MIERVPQEAILRAINGDRHAFRDIVESHQNLAYAVAFRIVGNCDDAEDITQEAFIRLWRNLSKYNRDIKLSTWLYKIVTNLCLDFLKSKQHRRSKLNDSVEAAVSMQTARTPATDLEDKDLNVQIEKATRELPPMQKAVFVLRDLEALTVEETCDVLSLTADQVKSNLCQARRNVSKKLKAIYETDYREKL